jgi:hypothetical protein
VKTGLNAHPFNGLIVQLTTSEFNDVEAPRTVGFIAGTDAEIRVDTADDGTESGELVLVSEHTRVTVKVYDCPMTSPVAVQEDALGLEREVQPVGVPIPPESMSINQLLCVQPCNNPGVHCSNNVFVRGKTLTGADITEISAGTAGLLGVDAALATLLVLGSTQPRVTVNEYELDPVKPEIVQDVGAADVSPLHPFGTVVVPA